MQYKLNYDQQFAVESTSSKILCLAGAGTGKTRTLIERVVYLVKTGINPQSILSLTFTNAAAFEMRERYREYIKDGESPEFRTFHSFCYELISTNLEVRKALGFTTMPSIATDAQQKKIEKEAIMQSGIKLSKKKESSNNLSALDKRNLDILNKCKKRLMVKNGLITFDELCTGVCNLFITKNKVVDKYFSRIKYLLVDEYQDTDRIQHNFVMSFEDTAKIFIVGDALQNLYSFRGTTSDIIKSISVDTRWNVIKLKENYRSTKEICDFANNFSKTYADDSYRIPIHSDRSGGSVNIRPYAYSPDSKLYHNIYERISSECKCFQGSVAILARTNMECAEIRKELDSHGLQYSTQHKDLDARYVLPSVMDSNYMITWLATFLTSEKYAEFIRISKISETSGKPYTEQMFLSKFGDISDIHDRAETIYRIRGIMNMNIDIDIKCKSILKTIGYPNLNVDISNVKKVSEFINAIIVALDERPEQDSDVYVGTIHSVKGLEYDLVYVIGVDGYKFKLNTEDNKNVYYVAITRAKNHLVIYS